MDNRSALKRGHQLSSPGSPVEIKKPRRSQRLAVGDGVDEGSTTPSTAPELATAALTSTMSPPSRPEVQRTPASSPTPQETQATQVASQVLFPFGPQAEEEEYDPDVWGYLDPISGSSSTRKSIKLNKKAGCSPGNQKNQKAKKASASGFLIGRHPECDLHVDSAVISNRHCVIYKEISAAIPRAVLEDLSSNGTWVNGVIVGRNKRRELESGDELEVAGGYTYHFRYPTGMFASHFHETYELGPPLGSGHFATVYTAVEKKTGTSYAVKIFTRRRTEDPSKTQGLQQEIAMLMSVSHPNVLCLKGTYDEDDGVYLVLELAPEGELFNYIIKHQKLTEDETRIIFKQLLNGLKYLHDRNIVHRDIKPENILLIDRMLTVKLADFGLAKIIGEDSFTTSLCGTPSYVAPEILANSEDRKYTRAVDMWSLGVVLYICLCGFPPFSDELYSPENPFTLSQQIINARYDFPSPYWDTVGDPALDLIERLLELNSKKRITADEALEHPWITGGSFNPADSCRSLTDAIENLGFVRRWVKHERTLLAEAPGLANSATQNPSKAKVRVTQPDLPNVEATGQDSTKDSIDANTKAFINVGGKGGDETLYGDSYDVSQPSEEGKSDDQ